MARATRFSVLAFCLIAVSLLTGCGEEPVHIPDRESLIPPDAPKMSPANDPLPPVLLSDEFQEPVPLPYPVNTRGAEDSPFVLPDGNTLYVWFTPNNRQDVVEQSQDLVTGIYKFQRTAGGWSDPERIWLVEPGTPHLDGCGFFQGDQVWICGVREGYDGLHWFTAEQTENGWTTAQPSDFPASYQVGELHISRDGSQLFFHSSRPGGQGGLDIWTSQKVGGEWGEPVNLITVNSEFDEGWPALNPQEDELWITRNYSIWRSKKVDGEWTEPEEIVSNLAGEAAIDSAGNVYFTHHYFEGDTMIEADIYLIERKSSPGAGL
jgi:hypothetical protein